MYDLIRGSWRTYTKDFAKAIAVYIMIFEIFVLSVLFFLIPRAVFFLNSFNCANNFINRHVFTNWIV